MRGKVPAYHTIIAVSFLSAECRRRERDADCSQRRRPCDEASDECNWGLMSLVLRAPDHAASADSSFAEERTSDSVDCSTPVHACSMEFERRSVEDQDYAEFHQLGHAEAPLLQHCSFVKKKGKKTALVLAEKMECGEEREVSRKQTLKRKGLTTSNNLWPWHPHEPERAHSARCQGREGPLAPSGRLWNEPARVAHNSQANFFPDP